MEITVDLQYNFIKMITIKTIQAHVKKDLLEAAISEEYCRLAEKPDSGFHFVTGWKLAEIVNYDFRLLKELPEGAVARFAGVGNPFAMGKPLPGQTVLDIGSGAGMDALLAAKMVGYEGFVYGIDLTPEMVELAQQHADNQGADNLAFIHASAESIPLADNSIDMVISNGVINLCHDKERVFSEIVRVLKPGGKLQIADVVLENPVSDKSKEHQFLWTNCVAGGLVMLDYYRLLVASGFTGIYFHEPYDVFSQAEVYSAAWKYGAKGWNISANI